MTVPKGCPDVGERVAPARRTWTLTAGGEESSIHTTALFGDAMVLLGSYSETLTVDSLSAAGGGLFAAWIDREGRAQRLERLAGRRDRSTYFVAAHVHAERLWVLIHFEDRLDFQSAEDVAIPGANHALVALDASGRVTEVRRPIRVAPIKAQAELTKTPLVPEKEDDRKKRRKSADRHERPAAQQAAIAPGPARARFRADVLHSSRWRVLRGGVQPTRTCLPRRSK